MLEVVKAKGRLSSSSNYLGKTDVSDAGGVGSSTKNTEIVLDRTLDSLIDMIVLQEKQQRVHRFGWTQKEQQSATWPPSSTRCRVVGGTRSRIIPYRHHLFSR